jgi:hypothetical protein
MPSFLASSHRACHLPVHAKKMMAKVYKRCCNFILQFLRVHREEDIFLSVHWRFERGTTTTTTTTNSRYSS